MRFVTSSLLILLALYGLVFAIGDAYLLHGGVPLWGAIVFAVVLIGIQYLVAPWLIEFFFSIDWDPEVLPARQRLFLEQLCRQHNLPPIRIGIIESGTPNAFAFGRLRSDARIVVTRGLLDLLTEDETNAVLAHELGHIAHYDFAVMALASLAPLILYQLYFWTDRVSNLRIVSYFAYLGYWVGQFLVLLLNRTREYGADHFSAHATGQPTHLASALVKIGYGMIRERSETRRILLNGTKDEKQDARTNQQLGSSLGLMGIAAARGSDAMALAADSPEQAARIMRWDLVNPWARLYELNSTHPLTAFRLRALNREAAVLHQAPTLPLPDDTRTRWTGFPIEFLFWLAPLASGFLLFSWFWAGRAFFKELHLPVPPHLIPDLVLTLGLTWAARIAFRYRGNFAQATVTDLLEDLNVSQMRPRAVELKGEVIGHGIPGAYWSPDLVLRDETGLIFLLYRSSVPFGRLFFALRSADRFVGEQVTIRGWYRRGLKPYVEIASVEARVPKAHPATTFNTLFGGESVDTPTQYECLIERSYSRWIQLALAAACTALGIIWLS